ADQPFADFIQSKATVCFRNAMAKQPKLSRFSKQLLNQIEILVFDGFIVWPYFLFKKKPCCFGNQLMLIREIFRCEKILRRFVKEGCPFISCGLSFHDGLPP